MSGNITDESIEKLRGRTLEAVRRADARVRRRHRAAAVVSTVVVAALLTAGGVALTAPPPPPPLTPEEEFASYEDRIEARWAELRDLYPGAVRPDVEFERFITQKEEGEVVGACLREQGIPAETDEHGWNVQVPIGEEREYDLAIFACEVRFPLSPSLFQPFTDDELRYTYAYFVDQLRPCLIGRGYDIPTPPSFEEFAERWWTEETWGPYQDVVELDAEAFDATVEACPPMPPDLRP